MSNEKFSIEVDSVFIENLFGLADIQAPKDLNLDDLKDAVNKIKNKLNSLALSSINTKVTPINSPLDNKSENSEGRLKTVLIVDDLGIITYQLELLLKKVGFEVVISNEIYDAIDKFKKQDFGFAIIDLFIPTEREGFILLDEIKKLSLLCKLNTKIIVITASSKNEYKIKCVNRGADFYIEKTAGWQGKILEACES